MASIEKIVLLRHGETLGESSVRFHGAGNVWLSELGADQARAASRRLGSMGFDLVVASPLQRAWKSASIAIPGAPILLEPGFREIHFGRWEGLTLEEIEAGDPELCAEWRQRRPDFVFPGGESRLGFRLRVRAALERLLSRPARSVLIVSHKGVVRALVEDLVGEGLEDPHPELGSWLTLGRASGRWRVEGLSVSDPDPESPANAYASPP